ncbi:hypothetical protein VTN77DRAFT_1166 [Rasamsonia byssochlamydoides]|uniref:uncharacterized protein n=1 Tax=Rasamsonia byssochlamydoides TaxID=89139 RepID=UPI00374298A3
MSVDLEPSDLGFRRPFNREVSEILHLRNPNSDPVAFKVKTTAPKHYCVRPNSGRIEPGKHVEVQVLLQAMKEDPPLDAKCKDKFLVQSVAITGDLEFSNITSIFEKVPKAAIQERKIRVNYLPANVPNGSAVPDEEPPAYSSPGGAYETPAPTAAKKVADDVSPIPQPEFTDRSRQETSPESTKERPVSATESSKSAAANTLSASNEELKSQLAQAQAQIQKLKEQLADQGLRLRKSEGGAAQSTAPLLQQQHPQSAQEIGVPVQIVAGLCLLSFLLAYFFF